MLIHYKNDLNKYVDVGRGEVLVEQMWSGVHLPQLSFKLWHAATKVESMRHSPSTAVIQIVQQQN